MMSDNVKHPKHYTEGRKYEPIEVIKDWELNFDLGCVVKYVSRFGRKEASTPLEDLYKAKYCLEHEIKHRERKENSTRIQQDSNNGSDILSQEEMENMFKALDTARYEELQEAAMQSAKEMPEELRNEEMSKEQSSEDSELRNRLNLNFGIPISAMKISEYSNTNRVLTIKTAILKKEIKDYVPLTFKVEWDDTEEK